MNRERMPVLANALTVPPGRVRAGRPSGSKTTLEAHGMCSGLDSPSRLKNDVGACPPALRQFLLTPLLTRAPARLTCSAHCQPDRSSPRAEVGGSSRTQETRPRPVLAKPHQGISWALGPLQEGAAVPPHACSLGDGQTATPL